MSGAGFVSSNVAKCTNTLYNVMIQQSYRIQVKVVSSNFPMTSQAFANRINKSSLYVLPTSCNYCYAVKYKDVLGIMASLGTGGPWIWADNLRSVTIVSTPNDDSCYGKGHKPSYTHRIITITKQ